MLILGNGEAHNNQMEQIKWEVVIDTSMMFDDNNNKNLGVSSKIKVAVHIDQTYEMIGQLVLTYL